MFPGNHDEHADMSKEQREAAVRSWEERYRRGPVGLLFYDPHGREPMRVGSFVGGFILNLFAAFMAAWFLQRSTASASPYLARVAFCGMLGVFAAIVSHLTAWNWFGFPLNYTSAMVADLVIGWLLAGLAIGAIIKPKETTA